MCESYEHGIQATRRHRQWQPSRIVRIGDLISGHNINRNGTAVSQSGICHSCARCACSYWPDGPYGPSTHTWPGPYRLNALVIVVALAAWPSAVVHVVDQVRRDEGKRRKLVVRQIGGQVRIGHVGTGAAVQRRYCSGASPVWS